MAKLGTGLVTQMGTQIHAETTTDGRGIDANTTYRQGDRSACLVRERLVRRTKQCARTAPEYLDWKQWLGTVPTDRTAMVCTREAGGASGSLAAAPWPTWAATTWTCSFGPSNLARPRLSRPMRSSPHASRGHAQRSPSRWTFDHQGHELVFIGTTVPDAQTACLHCHRRQWAARRLEFGRPVRGRRRHGPGRLRTPLPAARASVRGLHSAATKHPQFDRAPP